MPLTDIRTAEDIAAEALVQLRARIRTRRDMAIRAGITVAGIAVATDDLSQQRLTAAALAAVLDPTYAVQWKAAAGFVTLDAPTVIAIAQAVRAHVQSCFDHEAALLAQIDTGEVPDIEAGWPGDA